MISLIWREIETPSNQIGPLHRAYERAVIGIGHAMLGACAAVAFGGYGPPFALAVGGLYWLMKERGDLKRGGGLWDGVEDALMVTLGTYYGPAWWPPMIVATGAYLMAMGARRV